MTASAQTAPEGVSLIVPMQSVVGAIRDLQDRELVGTPH